MKDKIHVSGMHCKSCEVLLEKEISDVKGVQKVYASNTKGLVVMQHDENYSKEDVIKKITDAGYKVGKEDLPIIKMNGSDFFEISFSVVLIFLLIFIFTRFDITRSLLGGMSSTNLISIFLIGIAAGLSTCMALVGGLILGVSARYSEKHPDSTILEKFRPHLFFNLGRITSYFILGGVIGSLGAIFQLSGSTLGIIMIAIGIVMFFLGIKILEIFPRFNYGLTLPKFITKILNISKRKDKEYSHLNSFVLGSLTFFVPCGFTQAMQVVAIGTGSFMGGALVMAIFALGTTPGLLGIGGLTASLNDKKKNSLFFKLIGILVIFMAFYNIINGINLSGLRSNISNITKSEESSGSTPSASSADAQLIKTTYSNEKILDPQEFTVKVNQPVKLEIFAQDDGEGCMGSVMIPGLVNKAKYYEKGKTITLEFTAKKSGEYWITCAMGIPAGKITVIK